MKCRSAEPLISAFLEDDLTQNERRSLEAHLLSCRRCSLSVRELRATLTLMQSIPEVDTGPHFEADLLARIRSGEGLRPSMVEWLRGYLEPARLRPLFLAGAGACAVWIGVMLLNPSTVSDPSGASRVASGTSGAVETAAPSIDPIVLTPPPDAPKQDAAATPTNSGAAAVASRGSKTLDRSQPSAARGTASAGYDWAEGDWPLTRSGQDSTIPNPGSRYVDEYITDQFFLEQGIEGSSNRTITPVSDRPSDDVYITF